MRSPIQVGEEIETLDEELSTLPERIGAAARKAAETEVAYKVAFAQERLKVRDQANEEGRKITVDEVEDRATIATKDQRQASLIAANHLLALREAKSVRQSQMDGKRSLLSSFKAAGA